MTTVAIDRRLKIMAADGQMTEENVPGECVKIFPVGDVIVSGAGTLDEIQLFVERVMKGKKRPKLKDTTIACMTSKGDLTIYQPKCRYGVTDRFYTLGSGMMVAYAGLLDGKTPTDAVKLAAKADIYTNDKVTAYQWQKGEWVCLK